MSPFLPELIRCLDATSILLGNSKVCRTALAVRSALTVAEAAEWLVLRRKRSPSLPSM